MRRRRVLAVSWVLVLLMTALVAVAVGQSPSTGPPDSTSTAPPSAPTVPEAVVEPGDPRSEGGGPGLVGSPLTVLFGVVALGLGTAALTILAVRVTRPR